MSLYDKLAKNEFCKNLYQGLKKQKKYFEMKRRLRGKYKFIDNRKNKKQMCIILAGYKDVLWEDVFGRLEKYIPKNIDVCIASSGKYDEKLLKIAEKNKWSYLSLKRNNVALTQNIAIKLHPEAKYIYKMDEDIFVTKNSFEKMFELYKEVEKKGNYNIGFVAPMLPINGFSFLSVLNLVDSVKDYEKQFGRAIRTGDGSGLIIKNPKFAKYMWGETNKKLSNIDKLSEIANSNKLSYEICSIRFSIGMILFERKFWEELGYLELGHGAGMGIDEEQICKHCIINSKAIIVSNNSVVGHFSYGPQTKDMLEFYNNNRKNFKVKE